MSHMLPQFARHIGHVVSSSLILIIIVVVVVAVVVVVTKLYFFFPYWDKLDNGHKLPEEGKREIDE